MTGLVSAVTFLPAAGALLLLLVPRRRAGALRGGALLVALATLALSLPLFLGFDGDAAGYQFEEARRWMPTLGVTYHVGIDGISVLLVLLTTFLTPLVLASAWRSIEDRVKEFVVTMLILETGMLGVFVSLDLFLFYVFWEAMLIPMYFIIGVWGGPRRVYAVGQQPERLLAAHFSAHIVAFARLEAVAILGLVLHFLTGRQDWFWIFTGVAAFGMVLLWPKRGKVEALLALPGQSGLQVPSPQ